MNSKYDENSIETLLSSLKNDKVINIPDNFTLKVMDRIRQDNLNNIKSYDKLYLKFSVGASMIAAACLLLAVNLFVTYTPEMAEFAAIDYFNISIF